MNDVQAKTILKYPGKYPADVVKAARALLAKKPQKKKQRRRPGRG